MLSDPRWYFVAMLLLVFGLGLKIAVLEWRVKTLEEVEGHHSRHLESHDGMLDLLTGESK